MFLNHCIWFPIFPPYPWSAISLWCCLCACLNVFYNLVWALKTDGLSCYKWMYNVRKQSKRLRDFSKKLWVLIQKFCSIYRGYLLWTNLRVTGLVLQQSMKLDIIKSPLKLIPKQRFQHLVWEIAQSVKQICVSIVRQLVLCRVQVRPGWLAFFEDTSLCAIHATCVQWFQKTFN